MSLVHKALQTLRNQSICCILQLLLMLLLLLASSCVCITIPCRLLLCCGANAAQLPPAAERVHEVAAACW